MTPVHGKDKIQPSLLRWFAKNGRDLPWRQTRDPYAIWVSEIMLQQTQVATVIPYYEKFLKSFPAVHHLARADLQKVLKVWEGLGYYSRARNLHRASEIILNHFQGKIPDNLKDLLSLPGIGKYTAGAILSIAHNKEAAILDGNLKRVLSRLFAISGDPREKKTEDLLWQASESLIPKDFASSFNQALMDLGAMVCTPKDPQCLRCPLHHRCEARASGTQETYPTKGVKKSIPKIEAVSAVIQKDGKVLLNQRPLKGLLGGLWEYPNWKTKGNPASRSRLRLRLANHIRKEMRMDVKVKEFIGVFKQTYSHFKLTLHVFNCEAIDGKRKGRWVPVKHLHLFPMSAVHRRIAETIQLSGMSLQGLVATNQSREIASLRPEHHTVQGSARNDKRLS